MRTEVGAIYEFWRILWLEIRTDFISHSSVKQLGDLRLSQYDSETQVSYE